MIVNDEVIKRCKENDSQAQRTVYEAYSPIMFVICMRYLAHRNEAADAMQDGFIQVFTKIKQFQGSGSFEGWVKRIMVNQCLMIIRQRPKCHLADIDAINETKIVHDNETEDDESAKGIITNADFTNDEILEVVSQLPEGYRVVFNLYALENYKHKEIATMLNISVNTSKTQLIRARKRLQEKLLQLAQKREKEQNKKAILIFAAMNTDNHYIDLLVKQSLDTHQITPPMSWDAFSNQLANSNLAVSSQTATSLGSRVLETVTTYIKSKIIIFSASVFVGIISTIIYFEIDKKEDKTEVTKPAINQIDNSSKSDNKLMTDSTSKFEIKPSIINNNNSPELSKKIIQPKINEINNPAKATVNTPLVIDTVKVPVKKVIVVPKKVFVSDTIKHTDTLKVKK